MKYKKNNFWSIVSHMPTNILNDEIDLPSGNPALWVSFFASKLVNEKFEIDRYHIEGQFPASNEADTIIATLASTSSKPECAVFMLKCILKLCSNDAKTKFLWDYVDENKWNAYISKECLSQNT